MSSLGVLRSMEEKDRVDLGESREGFVTSSYLVGFGGIRRKWRGFEGEGVRAWKKAYSLQVLLFVCKCRT